MDITPSLCRRGKDAPPFGEGTNRRRAGSPRTAKAAPRNILADAGKNCKRFVGKSGVDGFGGARYNKDTGKATGDGQPLARSRNDRSFGSLGGHFFLL